MTETKEEKSAAAFDSAINDIATLIDLTKQDQLTPQERASWLIGLEGRLHDAWEALGGIDKSAQNMRHMPSLVVETTDYGVTATMFKDQTQADAFATLIGLEQVDELIVSGGHPSIEDKSPVELDEVLDNYWNNNTSYTIDAVVAVQHGSESALPIQVAMHKLDHCKTGQEVGDVVLGYFADMGAVYYPHLSESENLHMNVTTLGDVDAFAAKIDARYDALSIKPEQSPSEEPSL